MSSIPPFPPNGGEGGLKDESSRSFFLDTQKGMEIDLLLLEGELHPASFIRKSNLHKKLETGLEKGSIEKDWRRMLPLPDGYASELEDLIDDRFCILMLLEAKFRLQF